MATEFGKPYAVVDSASTDMSFNVSHSGWHGLIAVAKRGRLGVDVEERVYRQDFVELGNSVFSQSERAEIAFAQGDDQIRKFFVLWTIKEAPTKALGTGLSLDLSQAEIPRVMRLGQRTALFQFPNLPGVRWRLDDLASGSFAGALAQEIIEISVPADTQSAYNWLRWSGGLKLDVTFGRRLGDTKPTIKVRRSHE